jgi:hypothetical protein
MSFSAIAAPDRGPSSAFVQLSGRRACLTSADPVVPDPLRAVTATRRNADQLVELRLDQRKVVLVLGERSSSSVPTCIGAAGRPRGFTPEGTPASSARGHSGQINRPIYYSKRDRIPRPK